MKKWLLIVLAVVLAGCSPAEPSGEHYALDTLLRLTVYDGKPSPAASAWEEVDALEKIFSKTIPDSEIARLNRGESVALSRHTRMVLETALAVSRASGGAFDVTIAPVMALWDFGGEPRVPGAEELAGALERVGWERLTPGETMTLPAGMSLDLGGIAKGYIADCLSRSLAAQGRVALIDLGGNLSTVGEKPDGTPWRIGIRDPKGGANDAICVLNLWGSRAIVTSGTYERGFTRDGVYYHHILDPETGYPADQGLLSVTIVASDAMTADALSTACMVLGAEEGLKLVETFPDTEALFLLEDGSRRMTEGMEALLAP